MAIRASLICTVKNEEGSIRTLLDSFLAQTKPSDDIVIVDGGSTDRTQEIIRSYIEKGAPFRLIVEEGANISRGRNTAVRNSKYDIIASTDAGCVLEKTWLEYIIAPLEEDRTVDVSCGSYRYTGDTHFEKAVARIISKRMPMIDDVIMPSSRSIAFRKSAWQKVGGYPEDLQIAEDTTFDHNLKAAGCKFKMAEDAIVLAKTRANPKGVYKQYFNYSKWDMIANNLNSKGRTHKAALLTSLVAILIIITIADAPLGLLMMGLATLYYVIRYGMLVSLKTYVLHDVS